MKIMFWSLWPWPGITYLPVLVNSSHYNAALEASVLSRIEGLFQCFVSLVLLFEMLSESLCSLIHPIAQGTFMFHFSFGVFFFHDSSNNSALLHCHLVMIIICAQYMLVLDHWKFRWDPRSPGPPNLTMLFLLAFP